MLFSYRCIFLYFRMNGVSYAYRAEDLLSTWSALNSTCNLCCTSEGCNDAPVPVHQYQPVFAAACSISSSIATVLLLVGSVLFQILQMYYSFRQHHLWNFIIPDENLYKQRTPIAILLEMLQLNFIGYFKQYSPSQFGGKNVGLIFRCGKRLYANISFLC